MRALLAIDPKNKLIEPVTNWLVKNRRGAQWSNTRDTAIVVLTLNDYLRVSGELQPVLGYELLVNGKSLVTKQITADALSAPSKFEIPREVTAWSDEIPFGAEGTGQSTFPRGKFFSLKNRLPRGNEILFGVSIQTRHHPTRSKARFRTVP